MGNFRSDSRGGSRGGFGGRRSGGFSRGGDRGGFRDRDSGFGERRRPQMHEATCDKCKKQCEVPFKPTGDKPVFCSDCFKKEDSSNSKSNFGSDSRPRSRSFESSGISVEQFNKLSAKVDKILEILESIEFEDEEEGEIKN